MPLKKKKGLRTIRSHGESGDCDEAAVAKRLPIFRGKLQMYSLKDTFNADEIGLNYRTAPNTTIAREGLSGKKKKNQRISVPASANVKGSKEYELRIIGSS